jgi:hypothetical protein
MNLPPSATNLNPSRFREHLPVSLPQDDVELEQSRFSPDTPPPDLHRSAMWSSLRTPKTARDIPEDVESRRSYRLSNRLTTLRDKFADVYIDIGALGNHNSNADFNLGPFLPLLDVEKAQAPPPATNTDPSHSPPQKQQKKRKFGWGTFLLILVILALLGDLAFLNVRVIELTNKNTPSAPAPTSNTSNLPSDADECLSQFTINAPSNPSAYPCSTCFPILSHVTNSSDAANAVQFCGLRSIIESTSTTGKTALINGGWGKDLRVCTWSGVSCSDTGSVTSL